MTFVGSVRAMRIVIRGPGLKLTRRLRGQVERRLGFALCRFGDRIDRVTLRFSDAELPGGGVEKRCRIDVGLQPRRVRVEHSDDSLLLALDRAADRISRSVARAL